jgi:hypothetical protein
VSKKVSERTTGSGLSRRDALKRGAIIGGAAWTAPMLQTISAPAFAQASPISTCTDLFVVQIEQGAHVCAGPGFGGRDCLGENSVGTGGAANGCGKLASIVENADGTWTVTLAQGCEFTAGFSKCGSPTNPAGCKPAQQVAPGVITFFPCPSGPQGQNQGISNIQLLFCCAP